MAQSSATPPISQECDLCGCDRRYAWPRVLLREYEDESRNRTFFWLEPKNLWNAIRSGCRACAFLKEGIKRFEAPGPCYEMDSGSDVSAADSLDPDEPWVRYRDFDKGWVIFLRCGKEGKSSLILEFNDADGK